MIKKYALFNNIYAHSLYSEVITTLELNLNAVPFDYKFEIEYQLGNYLVLIHNMLIHGDIDHNMNTLMLNQMFVEMSAVIINDAQSNKIYKQ